MSTWQHARTNSDWTHRAGITTINTRRTTEHALTHDIALELVELTLNVLSAEWAFTLSRHQSGDSGVTNLTNS